MIYNFDNIIDRRGTGSYKWDSPGPTSIRQSCEHAADMLPMWVADMDFATAPCIVEALRRRVEHGIFGYTLVTDDYYDAVINWFSRRHGWQIERSSIMYTTGVVPAISAVIKALTRPGDKVITQTPAYNCFFSSIRNNGCLLAPNNLVYSPAHTYSIDFADLEAKACDERATLLLLCNPHNPSGRVWTAGELTRIGDICRRHGVTIVSDEIHCELTYDGHDYTPLQSVYDGPCVTCVSPSKAFNIAGLQIASIITRCEDFRRRIDRAINDNEVCDVNPFGVTATIAAYNEGGEWLDALRRYLWGNYLSVRRFFAERLPHCPVLPLEGTYLVWVDVRHVRRSRFQSRQSVEELADRLYANQHIRVNPGTMYGPGGEGFLRLNIACPRSRVEDALLRIEQELRAKG